MTIHKCSSAARTGLLFVALTFGAVVAAPAVHAQSGAFPIAVVQLQDILRKSKAANGIRQQIESTSESYKNEVQAEEERLRGSEQELIQQRSLLSPEVFDEKRREFRDQVTEVQKDVQMKRGALDRAYAEAMMEVQKNVSDIIKELARERGFKMAVPTASILYREESLDITDEVLARLDQHLPQVSVNINATAAN